MSNSIFDIPPRWPDRELTPKEKAEDLFYFFYTFIDGDTNIKIACTKVVNEIIASIPSMPNGNDPTFGYVYGGTLGWWFKVKEEIDKI